MKAKDGEDPEKKCQYSQLIRVEIGKVTMVGSGQKAKINTLYDKLHHSQRTPYSTPEIPALSCLLLSY